MPGVFREKILEVITLKTAAILLHASNQSNNRSKRKKIRWIQMEIYKDKLNNNVL